MLDRSAEETHDAEQQVRLPLDRRERAEQSSTSVSRETASDRRSYVGDTPRASRATNSAYAAAVVMCESSRRIVMMSV
jgi:hypothetical protein